MSLHRSNGVIGTDCEYTSPVPIASSSVRRHGLSDRRFCGASVMARVRSEAMIENRVGEICDGVNSCSSRSAAQIKPPGLPRRSMISPSCGSSASSRITSATNPSSSDEFEAPQTQVAVVAPGDRDHPGRHVVLELPGDPAVVGDTDPGGGKPVVPLVPPELGVERQLLGAAHQRTIWMDGVRCRGGSGRVRVRRVPAPGR